MKNTKKILSLLMAMLIFCQGLVLVSAVESSESSAEAVEWTYDNSMLVKINTEEAKIFTPEDFPDMNCIQVLTTEKIRTETGYSYELMLIFDTTEGFDWQATADALLEDGRAIEVTRNIYAKDYNMKHCTFTLTAEELFIPVGGKAWLEIEEEDYTGYTDDMDTRKAIVFTVDPAIIDEDAFTPESFINFGIDGFYPHIEWSVDNPGGGLAILGNSKKDDFLAVKSESHKYYGLSKKYDNYEYDYEKCLETINALSSLDGIMSVEYVIYSRAMNTYTPETWRVSSDNASLLLFGGEEDPITGVFYGKTAEITGVNVGDAVVTVSKRLAASCKVTVYLADANNDGECNSLDAALVLKYDAQMIEETNELLLCDMNSDGVVNSLDAAFILRYDAGLE